MLYYRAVKGHLLQTVSRRWQDSNPYCRITNKETDNEADVLSDSSVDRLSQMSRPSSPTSATRKQSDDNEGGDEGGDKGGASLWRSEDFESLNLSERSKVSIRREPRTRCIWWNEKVQYCLGITKQEQKSVYFRKKFMITSSQRWNRCPEASKQR